MSAFLQTLRTQFDNFVKENGFHPTNIYISPQDYQEWKDGFLIVPKAENPVAELNVDGVTVYADENVHVGGYRFVY
jgi:hypothetical protein